MKKVKKAQVSKDVENAKNKAALDGDIKTYFTERDKTMNMGAGKKQDTREMAEAEADVKEM